MRTLWSLDPIRLLRLEVAPGIGKSALQLALLECQLHGRRAFVADDDLEFRAEQSIRNDGHLDTHRIDAGAAHDDLDRLGLFVSFDRCILPEIADERVFADAADPGKLVDVEMRRLRFLERCGRNAVMDARDVSAVARRIVKYVIGRRKPARADHVLHDNGRMAGQMIG